MNLGLLNQNIMAIQALRSHCLWRFSFDDALSLTDASARERVHRVSKVLDESNTFRKVVLGFRVDISN